MTTDQWAEREVELACAMEQKEHGADAEYGQMCYRSALKAYKSLVEDGHSGMSWGITASILRRLMDDKPLSPITEEDFKVPEGVDVTKALDSDGRIRLACPRMFSLFQTTDSKTGKVSYSDVDRVATYYDNMSGGWHTREAKLYVDTYYPITLPYMPPEGKFRVHAVDLGNRPMVLEYLIEPSGTRVDLMLYYNEYTEKFEPLTEPIKAAYDEHKKQLKEKENKQ